MGRSLTGRLALAALLVLLTWSAAARAQLDEQSELDKARNAYLAHQYEEADQRFKVLLDPKNPVLHDRLLATQARMYWGAVMLAKNEQALASQQFEQLLTSDPTYEPDPLAFPTDVVNLFIDVRSRLRERLNQLAHDRALQEAERRAREEAMAKQQALRLQILEKRAGEERVVSVHSRWIALLPFGAGQFQNGQRGLGYGFLGFELALAAAAAITLPVYLADLHDEASAYSRNDLPATQGYHDRAAAVRDTNLGLNISFAAVALLGIIQAEVAFVPEEATLLHRPIPEAPTPAPPATAPAISWQASPVLPVEGKGGGATFGVVGRF
jgi:hypothetical protein